MSKSDIIPAYFELDEFGRATLSDDLLDAIHRTPDNVGAAGLNGGFCGETSNGECTNSLDCRASANNNCTNTGECVPASNTNCPRGTTDPGPGGA